MNTRIRQLPLLLLAVAGAAGVLAGSDAAEESATVHSTASTQVVTAAWKAVAASGRVESRPEGSQQKTWQQVRRGDELQPLSLVHSGRRGRATLTRNANIIVVDPNSELQLPTEGPDGVSRVLQTSGNVVYEVERQAEGKFEVITPYLVAGVKGTVFGVSVTERYAVVSVEEGVVEVRSQSSDRRIEVHAGESVLFDAASEADIELYRERDSRERVKHRSPKQRRLVYKVAQRLSEAGERRYVVSDDEARLDPDAESIVVSVDEGLDPEKGSALKGWSLLDDDALLSGKEGLIELIEELEQDDTGVSVESGDEIQNNRRDANGTSTSGGNNN